MTSEVERRALTRLEIPGSIAFYKKDNNLNMLQRFSEMMELKNITKSGICLQAKNGIKKGDRLMVQIVIPGENKIVIKGRVRWKASSNNNLHEIGVQFEPFGQGRHLNSISSLEKLRSISEQYLH